MERNALKVAADDVTSGGASPNFGSGYAARANDVKMSISLMATKMKCERGTHNVTGRIRITIRATQMEKQ